MRYFLELCIRSVKAAITDLNAEIIVVDNNSSDGSCDMIKRIFPEINLIENTQNLGFSKANNQGVLEARGEYVCVLNPDTVVAEDTFIKLLAFAKAKLDLGIAGCRLIDGSGHFLPESKRNIPLVRIAFQKLMGKSKYYYANHIDENAIEEVDILVGAFMFLKRSVFHEVGGFDEDYFMYGEDIDISYKALKANYKNYYFGKTTVLHFKGESTLKDKFYANRFYGSMQIFYEKHFKANIVFDTLVKFGVQLFYAIRKEPEVQSKKVEQYYCVSNVADEALEKQLKKEMFLVPDATTVKDYSEVIFDAKFLGYKKIIDIMLTNNKPITFKILPKESNFIIGSDLSYGRGEIIMF